ncbi:MAG: hypothetical protein PHV43_01410 [Candidatus Colwellbacteria bacterium]|nr:hypothetical protein [Candidatus Colwellbacteria bacterium]
MIKREDKVDKLVLGLRPLPPESYKNLDLDRLAIFAMSILEKKKIPLYWDYISVSLFKMFPTKFSMASFNIYPDTNRINKSLRRLVDPRRKNWATGSIETGFYITDLGKEMAMQTENLLKTPSRQKKHVISRRSRGRSSEQDVTEIIESQLFQKWCGGNYEITDYEVLAFLKAVPYTPHHLLVEYLEQLKRAAVIAKSGQTIKFLSWIEKRFANLFK